MCIEFEGVELRGYALGLLRHLKRMSSIEGCNEVMYGSWAHGGLIFVQLVSCGGAWP